MADKETQEEFQRDWYKILDCTKDSTKKEIEKSARKLFLKYHPDKTSDVGAPEKFLLVQKAKEILLDDEKRKAIDEKSEKVLKRKQYEDKRNASMDDNRKRMRDALNQRVAEATQTTNKSATAAADEQGKKVQLQNEKYMKQMREKNLDFMQKSSEEYESSMKEKNRIFVEKKNSIAEGINSNYSTNCQIKVKWKRSLAHTIGKDDLRKVFSIFGSIEETKLTGVKGTSGSIIFKSQESAVNAMKAYISSDEYKVAYISDALNYENAEKSSISEIPPAGCTNAAGNSSSLFTLNASSGINEKYPGLFSEMQKAAETQFCEEAVAPSSKDGFSAQTTGVNGSSSSIHQTDFKIKPDDLLEKESEILKKMMEAKALKKKNKKMVAAAVAAKIEQDAPTQPVSSPPLSAIPST